MYVRALVNGRVDTASVLVNAVPTCFRTPLINEGYTNAWYSIANVGLREFYITPPLTRISEPYYIPLERKWFADYSTPGPADELREDGQPPEWRLWNIILRMRCVGNANIGAIWGEKILEAEVRAVSDP